MTLLDKYNYLLNLARTIIWFDNVKSKRGYLTQDEKDKLNAAKKELKKLEVLPKQLSF